MRRRGRPAGALAAGDRTWNFASRLDDVAALEAALALIRTTRRPPPCSATGVTPTIGPMTRSGTGAARPKIDPNDPVVWRNLAVAAFNHEHDPEAATAAYERALALVPGDAKLVFERDQLLKRIGAATQHRLERLEERPELIMARDDLAVEYCQLLVNAGRPAEALRVLTGRRFQPWEGGEGQVLRAWERTHLALADAALDDADAADRGQPRPGSHPQSGLARRGPASAGQPRAVCCWPSATRTTPPAITRRATQAWQEAAAAVGDFAAMSPQAYSENTYFSVLAARRLGEIRLRRPTRRRADPLRRHAGHDPSHASTTSPPRCRRCCCSTTTRNAARTSRPSSSGPS